MGEAVSLFEQAVAADPGESRAQFALGRARLATGDSAGALAALTRARELGADFADVHYGIGSVHAALGEMSPAVDAFVHATARDPDHLGAQHGLLACLDAMPASVDANLLAAAVTPLLRGSCVNPRALGHACARVLGRRHDLEGGSAACDELLEDEIARLYLTRTINVSAPLERLLTGRRAEWLARVADGETLARTQWERAATVAVQCFLNEFVWRVTPEERQAIDGLEGRLDTRRSSGADDAFVSGLLVYACYRPLRSMAGAEALAASSRDGWPEAVRDVLRICLEEPLHEQRLETLIPSDGPIDDAVSMAVRSQYEENPYPRWVAVTRGGARTLEARVRDACPAYTMPAGFGDAPRILVAGCGTGMEAIDLALHVRDARVTAIDLSRASLAYGMRKAEEYGLGNLRFRHADILAFTGEDAPYHMISCAGVLHHMGDVAVGLARLVPWLRPGGLMKIALYSRVARAPLMAVREKIRAAGLGPGHDDIRRLRGQVLDAGEGGPHAELMGSTDFYSMSECRDLLFHVQELALAIPEIRALLDDAGLDFLGFELPIAAVAEGFRREHPAAAHDDLDAWHVYEQRHPESFRGMYHFWCRRAGG